MIHPKPSPAGLTIALALLFCLTGLTGHDPWKQDEAYSFGIILNMVESGDWVVPRLAHDPFMEKPPVYYWTAAGFMELLEGHLPAHDAARLASGFYLLLTLGFTAIAARLVWGAPAGSLAVLVWISTLVVIQHGHYLITDTALSAGLALGLLGLVLGPRHWSLAGLALGSGAGLAFLAKGLLGPGMLGMTALVLLLWPTWRCRASLWMLGLAALAALPWVLIWPTALYLRDPGLFQLWFWDNNLGRYFGGVELGPPAEPGFWWRTFPWATFPAAPLAGWALWVQRRAVLKHPFLPAVLVLTSVGWSVLFLAHTARDLYALPLIAPLAIIAAGGVTQLPGRLHSLSFWISAILFTGLAGLLWLLWLIGSFNGLAPDWSWITRHLPRVHDFSRSGMVLGFAILLTLSWIGLLGRIRGMRPEALLAWPAGVVLVWGLVAALHLPWIDQAKSYGAVFTALSAHLPEDFNCVTDLTEPESLRLRESERGLLHYFTGVRIQHASTPEQTHCDLLLLEVQRRRHREGVSPGPEWELLWRGQRPADRRDQFLLFRRRPLAATL